jgi:hypothetical protein
MNATPHSQQTWQQSWHSSSHNPTTAQPTTVMSAESESASPLHKRRKIDESDKPVYDNDGQMIFQPAEPPPPGCWQLRCWYVEWVEEDEWEKREQDFTLQHFKLM